MADSAGDPRSTASQDGRIDVSMFTPWHARCGVRDYAAHLISALDTLPQIGAIRVVAAPEDAARNGIASVLSHHPADSRRFQRLGREMNAGASVAHIQHQYFLFGGVAPFRTHIKAFLNELKVPAVMTVHEIAAEGSGFLNRRLVSAANRINFVHPSIKALIVHTEADRQRLWSMGLPQERVHLIRHPIPPAQTMPDREAARRALDRMYPSLRGRRIITLFGFLSNKKGHMIALPAMTYLPDDFALLFAGDQHPDDHTDYVSTLHAEVERLELDQRVVFTGYVAEDLVPIIMAATDIAIAPFLRTSGSGSLANLFAYGRAVIASDIEPHRELLAEAPGVLSLVPPLNPEALAAEIVALARDDARREGLSRAALAYAARNSYVEMARETVRVYDEVMR